MKLLELDRIYCYHLGNMFIQIDRDLNISLTKQLCQSLRENILNHEIVGGTRLPSTRDISKEIGVSRNIVLEAFDQLKAEGYLESKKGSGTFVTKGLELDMGIIRKSKKRIKSTNIQEPIVNFAGGTPDLSLFPKKTWSKMLRDASMDSQEEHLNYPNRTGLNELQEVLKSYLFRSKGIKCEPEQIIILSGSAQGIQLMGEILPQKKRTIVLEDPNYKGITRMYNSMGIKQLFVPLDEHGIDISKLPNNGGIGAIMVTPSHHYPTGITLSIQRRVEIVKYARELDIPIIENDYDSEFRHTGDPIPSIHSLDRERVIHLGTFSESMFPALRIGYMVVPNIYLERVIDQMSNLSLSVPTLQQLALAYFTQEGYLERHISKMKRIYRKKRILLMSELQRVFGNKITISGDSTGLYLLVEMLDIKDFTKIVEKSEIIGLSIGHIINDYIETQCELDKLLIGYGNLDNDSIIKGVSLLNEVITSVTKL